MAGAFGASGRYLVGAFALRTFGLGFPYGTFIVNVLGAVLMGVFIHMLATKFNGSAELRTFFATGVLGGFTTFSAFSLELANMIERGNWSTALFYSCACCASLCGRGVCWAVRCAPYDRGQRVSKVTHIKVQEKDEGLRLDRWFQQAYPQLTFGKLQKAFAHWSDPS